MPMRIERSSSTWLLVLWPAFALVALSGCAAWRRPWLTPAGPPAPVVFSAQPTAAEIVAAINANTARVQSYVTHDAKFTVPGLAGLPIMTGSIALERPRRFRLMAGTVVSGPEIDLGSNSDLFWFWVKRNNPPALYYARHTEFATSPNRGMLPIEPTWVADALGLVELDPAGMHQGPLAGPNGTLELRSTVAGPQGPRTRVTVVDATRGWVLEQHLYESSGTLLASSRASDFRYDPQAMASLPRRVTLNMPESQTTFTIVVGQVSLNTPVPGDAMALWNMPTVDAPLVDLGRPAGLGPVQPAGFVPAVPISSAGAQTQYSPIQVPPAAPATAQTLPSGGIELR